MISCLVLVSCPVDVIFFLYLILEHFLHCFGKIVCY